MVHGHSLYMSQQGVRYFTRLYIDKFVGICSDAFARNLLPSVALEVTI